MYCIISKADSAGSASPAPRISLLQLTSMHRPKNLIPVRDFQFTFCTVNRTQRLRTECGNRHGVLENILRVLFGRFRWFQNSDAQWRFNSHQARCTLLQHPRTRYLFSTYRTRAIAGKCLPFTFIESRSASYVIYVSAFSIYDTKVLFFLANKGVPVYRRYYVRRQWNYGESLHSYRLFRVLHFVCKGQSEWKFQRS